MSDWHAGLWFGLAITACVLLGKVADLLIKIGRQLEGLLNVLNASNQRQDRIEGQIGALREHLSEIAGVQRRLEQLERDRDYFATLKKPKGL